MAIQRSFSVATFDPTAIADTTALTNALHMTLAATSTTGLLVSEICMVGQATGSAIKRMQWARNSTIGVTPTALAAPNSDGPLTTTLSTMPSSPGVSFVAASTPPQRSAVTTAARLQLGFNAYGGIHRWFANPGGEWGIAGVAVNLSESSLSNYTGGEAGAIAAYIIYEAM